MQWTVAGALASVAFATGLQAQSADALLDKLVEKGVLTVDEADQMREEADKGFNTAYSVKSGLPEWVTALKINGDFRGRFEGFYADPEGGQQSTSADWVDRTRWRYRMRLGFVANLSDNFEVGFRLSSTDLDNATGISRGTDPISINQTYGNNAAKHGVGIDLAYMKWYGLNRPDISGVFTFGKMENPFVFSDIVFDGDYTPEGFGEQFSYTLASNHALKLNGGQFILDELGGSSLDPYLFGGQLRLDSTWNKRIATSLGASYLGIWNANQLSSSAVPDINAGNLRGVSGTGTSRSLGAPVHGFGAVVADAGITYTLDSFPMYPGAFPIRLFGDAMRNFSASTENNDGYDIGIQFGKAGKKKTWELSYRYKVLEGDAWYEELVDSDFGALYRDTAPASATQTRNLGTGYWAGTNVRGHVVKGGYSPYDFLTFNVTWFRTELIDEQLAGTDSEMNRLQVDAVIKF
jgi:hypothetical protein